MRAGVFDGKGRSEPSELAQANNSVRARGKEIRGRSRRGSLPHGEALAVVELGGEAAVAQLDGGQGRVRGAIYRGARLALACGLRERRRAARATPELGLSLSPGRTRGRGLTRQAGSA